MATQLKELLDEVGVKLDKIIAALTPGGGEDVGHPETILWFSDGTMSSYNWSGEIWRQNMIDAGLYSGNSWTKIITKAEIGTDVTSVGYKAFDGGGNNLSVIIPNSVTYIGTDAFFSSRLAYIDLGNSITTIDDTAFANTSLTSISFPSSISSIGLNILDSITSLASVTFQEKTMAEVQAMDNYSWGIKPGIDIVCSDGIIVAPTPGASSP